MSSFLYNSMLEDEARGAIDFDTDSFKAMLVTATYVAAANKDTHTKRSDVTNEVAAGGGYTAGGAATTVSITKDTANDRVDIAFSAVSWPSSTITAAGLVIYKARGGAASADELIAIVDFGGNIVSTAGTFAVTASTYRKQN